MGKRNDNKYTGNLMNRRARRKNDRETIVALGLLLSAMWTGKYFHRVDFNEDGSQRSTYFDRDGKRISSIEANNIWERERDKRKPRHLVRRRGKSAANDYLGYLPR